MLPALSPAQWITLAAVAAAGLVLAVLFLKLGLKLLKALLILILLAFVALLVTFVLLALRKGW
jgi:hypothetical protein